MFEIPNAVERSICRIRSRDNTQTSIFSLSLSLSLLFFFTRFCPLDLSRINRYDHHCPPPKDSVRKLPPLSFVPKIETKNDGQTSPSHFAFWIYIEDEDDVSEALWTGIYCWNSNRSRQKRTVKIYLQTQNRYTQQHQDPASRRSSHHSDLQ